MKVIFQIDEFKSLNKTTDTSLCLAKEALLRNFNVWFYTPDQLTYNYNKLLAVANQVTSISDQEIVLNPDQEILLNDADILFIRQNPPFDMNYITYTYLLDLLENTIIINNPTGIRNFTEKLSTLNFPELIIKSMVTSNPEQANQFLQKHKNIVCKPLYEFGGRDIKRYHIDQSDIFHIEFKKLCSKYKTPIMLQKFIPEVIKGDKRIIIVKGKPVGAIKRIPPANSIKANLCAGGFATKVSLSKQDLYIANTVGKELVKHDILFAGIDIIDRYLVEINVTSPTNIVTINQLYNLQKDKRIEYIIWDAILKKK